MFDDVPRFAAGVAAMLAGAVVAGLGFVHLWVDTVGWLLVFAVVLVVGVAVLAWGGRTAVAALSLPRVRRSVGRNG